MVLHLKKLCVGVSSVEDIRLWQEHSAFAGPGGKKLVAHVTRHTPRRVEEILKGGSLYWIVEGRMLCRNPIVGFEIIEGEAARRQRGRNAHPRQCAILLEAGPILTEARRHRPFQGWRYLPGADAPPDLLAGGNARGEDIPEEMRAELEELGLL